MPALKPNQSRAQWVHWLLLCCVGTASLPAATGQVGCQAPTAVITILSPDTPPSNDGVLTGCPGVPISLDGNASTAVGGASLVEWEWDFGNGNVQTNAAPDEVILNYGDPGEYVVTLSVTDDLGCTSITPAFMTVLISPEAEFSSVSDTPICVGSPTTIEGTFESGVWTSFIPPLVSEDVFLPDDFGIPFVSTLSVDMFDPGQVVSSCDDILSVTGSLFHTYIGDLTIQLECPNGQSMLILDNGPNGEPDLTGCMYPDLGSNDLGDPGSGTAWDYTWTDGASYIIDDPSNPAVAFGASVPAGDYLPCGNFCDLLGCPLNGDWNFIVVDTWPQDQGYLESWSLEFNPNILPNELTLTPSIGEGPDSSYWDVTIGENGVESLDPGADVAELIFDAAGIYDFTYAVQNNFGCSFDTTIQIEVIDAPALDITAGPDQIFCGNPVQLQGEFLGGGGGCASAQGNTTYCYGNNESTTWTYCPDDPGDGTIMEILFAAGEVESGWDYLQVFDGSSVDAPLIIELTGPFPETLVVASNPSGCLTVQLLSDVSIACTDFLGFLDPLSWSTGCNSPESNVIWNWEPSADLINPNTPQPTVTAFDGTPTAYVAYVEVPGIDNCVRVDTALVVPGFEYSVETADATCLLDDGMVTVNLNPNDPIDTWQGTLTTDNGTLLNATSTDGSPMVFSALVPGSYLLEVSGNGGQNCTYSTDLLIGGFEAPQIEATGEALICPGEEVTLTANTDPAYMVQWTVGGQLIGTGTELLASPLGTTTYTAQGIGPDGCLTPTAEVVVSVLAEDNCDCIDDGSLCSDPEACNYNPCAPLPTSEYCLLTEVVAEHTEGPLAGMTTYQVIFQALNPTDFVTSVSGDATFPSVVQTTTTFYQDLLGAATPQNISPLLLPLFPELAYDSWVTIGLDGPADAAAGEAPASTLQSPNQLWAETFDPGGGAPGGDIVMDDPIGGAWYVLNGDANGLPDEDGQVLLGQFTTDGVLSGNMQVQVFPEGDNINFLLLNLPLGVGVGCAPADSASCDYETCFGCTDPLACNYDAGADFDDGSCAIPGPCDICQDGVPVTVFDNDGDGICDDEDEILGCTDEEAYNFDPEADQDDGSCLDLGCIYPLACNYDPEAEVDDGGCIYPEFGEDCDGNCILDSDGDGICEGDDTCIGTLDECGICNGPGAVFECGCAPLPEGACDCDGNVPDATGECGGDCTSDVDADGVCDDEEIPGCTDPAACNFNPDATDDDGSCDLLSCLGCTDPAACNFDEEATVDDGSCALPGPCDVCEDGIPVSVFDEDGDGVCDDEEIPGCTNADANNYDPEATEDDGTCKVFGCTDPESLTYNPFATDEDGSCDYLCIGLLGCTYPDAVNYDPDAECDNGECTLDCSGSGSSGSCVLDYDGNGLIGANDLVYFLSWYELPCEP